MSFKVSGRSPATNGSYVELKNRKILKINTADCDNESRDSNLEINKVNCINLKKKRSQSFYINAFHYRSRNGTKILGPFTFYETMPEQTKRISLMRKNNPDFFEVLMDQGENLISCCIRGDLTQIKSIVSFAREGELFIWHSIKMFQAASYAGKVFCCFIIAV